MTTFRTCIAFLGALLCGGLVPTAPARSAAVISAQGPCTVSVDQAGSCLAFNYNFPPDIPIVRTYSFTAPSAGKAEVTLHGTLYCSAGGGIAAVVDLTSQIVTHSTDVPQVNGAGGLRQAMVFPAGPGSQNLSMTFNLASTRALTYSTGGKKTVYFKIARARMDPTTACFIYNAAFTVAFIP
jgi:hypothetical protein